LHGIPLARAWASTINLNLYELIAVHISDTFIIQLALQPTKVLFGFKIKFVVTKVLFLGLSLARGVST
jgi:hypothetical protein